MRLLSLPAPPLARTKPGTPHRPAGAGGHSRQPTAPGGHRAALPLPTPRTEASPLPHSAGSSGAPDSPAALTARAGPGPREPLGEGGGRAAAAGGGPQSGQAAGGGAAPSAPPSPRTPAAAGRGAQAHQPTRPRLPQGPRRPPPACPPVRPGGRGHRPNAARPARRPVPARCPAGSPPLPPRPLRSAPRTPRRPRLLWRAHTLRVTTLGRVTKREAAAARGAAPERGGGGRGSRSGLALGLPGNAVRAEVTRLRMRPYGAGAEEQLGSCSSREAALPSRAVSAAWRSRVAVRSLEPRAAAARLQALIPGYRRAAAGRRRARRALRR